MAACLDVFSRPMRPLSFGPVLALFMFAGAAAGQVGPPRSQTYPFGVGAGGFAVNETGHVSDVSGFANGGFHVFGEVVLEPGIFLQARYEHFTVPGTPVVPPLSTPLPAPDVRVDAGLMSVGYLYREEWWDAGLFAGWGVYGLKPKSPANDQAGADVRETVTGWHAGLVVSFLVARHWDLRIEFAAHTLRSDVTHTPLTLGGSVGYHF